MTSKHLRTFWNLGKSRQSLIGAFLKYCRVGPKPNFFNEFSTMKTVMYLMRILRLKSFFNKIWFKLTKGKEDNSDYSF